MVLRLKLPVKKEKTLKEAREGMLAKVAKGEQTICPCCYRVNKVYERSIKPSMAKQLERLYEHGGWMHTNSLMKGISTTREHSLLVHWGLIEQGHRGSWRITVKGEQFVSGQIKVPEVVYIYQNSLFAERPFSHRKVSFEYCLGVRHVRG